jgi:hypothetical protein
MYSHIILLPFNEILNAKAHLRKNYFLENKFLEKLLYACKQPLYDIIDKILS